MNVELGMSFEKLEFSEKNWMQNLIPILQITSSSSRLRVRCKCTKYTLYSIIQVDNANIE